MTFNFGDSIQRSILYLAKSDPDFYNQINSMVIPDYFESDIQGQIFKCINDYHDKFSVLPLDSVIMNEVCTSKNKLTLEDEIAYINKGAGDAVEHKEYFLDEVEKFAKEESMKLAITDSIGHLKEGNYGKIEELVKGALTVNRNVDTGHTYFTDYKQRFLDELDRSKRDIFATTFKSLNDPLEGGSERGEILMVAAPGGVGKSIAMVNQGVTSLIEGRKVLYITLEMSESRVAKRFDSMLTLVPQDKLKSEVLKVERRLETVAEKFGPNALRIKRFQPYQIDANTIKALLTNLKNYDSFVPDVIIIDYLELMNCTISDLPDYKSQERIVHELRSIGIEFDAFMCTCTQTNRDGKKVNIITDAELADSYGKIRACDLAYSLNQTQEEKDQGKMRIYAMKTRNGASGFLFEINIDYKTLSMKENPKTKVTDNE
jgi:replicative DNA helicase